MKKVVIGIISSIIFLSCVSTNNTNSGLSLHEAIEQSAAKISSVIPQKSRIVIAAFESPHENVSDYIIEELTGALFDLGFEVADRNNLPFVYQELNFQMSGEISDETAQSIGKFLAATIVVTGQLTDLDNSFRLRTNAIQVETAARTSITRFNVNADSSTRRLITSLVNQQKINKTANYGINEQVTPETAGAFLDRGIVFASRKEWQLAITNFTEAIRLNPDLSAAYALRGRAYYACASYVVSIGNNFSNVTAEIDSIRQVSDQQVSWYEMSINDFTQAIKLDPNNSVIYRERGVVYSDSGNFEKALLDYTEAIRLSPNYAWAYRNRGNTYEAKGDYTNAVIAQTQAISLDPNSSPAYVSRGSAYSRQGKYQEAISDYNQAIKMNPNYVRAYNNRGCVYMDINDLNKAIADFDHALSLDPNYSTSYRNRSVAYYRIGDTNRAITDLETILEINPNDASAKGDLEFIRSQKR
jgi:tetratricopeptide (TPR) repeat protein